MHRFSFNFKHSYAILLLLICYSACKDIPRDNILDPKNPSSYRPWIISIEAFVNTENDQLYNEYLLEALNLIAERYPTRVTIAEYHRKVATFDDKLSIPESELLYEDYVNSFDAQKGVPDVFINGAMQRVKGASSIAGATERLERVLSPLLKDNSHFTVEPEVSRQGSQLSVNIRLARLGSSAANNIYIRIVLVERIDNNLLGHVVRKVRTSNLIPEMEPGEVKEIKIGKIESDPEAKQSLIFYVISNDDLFIHQSTEAEIQ